MPITSRCNSRCKTCNVWKTKKDTDIDPAALKEALNDSYFNQVRTVGLNGGEFTLVPNFIEILKAVLTLPSIKGIALISNGLFPRKLFEYLKDAKLLCDEKGVFMNICISIDGVDKIHEQVRGVPNCFSRSKEILDELYNNKEKYCHSFSVGCTLSKYNIKNIRETEEFFSRYNNLKVEYHLAVPNKRIRTFDNSEDYYVLYDSQASHLATEFFYEKFRSSSESGFKRQQFVNFYFLKNRGKGRICKCDYLCRDVTIDESLNLALCATASEIVGNLKKQTIKGILNSTTLKREVKSLRKRCNTCIHYSYHPLSLCGRLVYINELLHNKYIFSYYSARSHKSFKVRTLLTVLLAKQFCHDYLLYLYLYLWKLQ